MSECAVGIRSGQHSTKIIGLVNPTTINGGGKSFGTHDQALEQKKILVYKEVVFLH